MTRRAFTLIELLVALGIIAVLVGLLLPCAFGDGSVRAVRYGVDAAVWRGVGTRAGGEKGICE